MSLYGLSWIKNIPALNTTGSESSPSISRDSNGNIYIAYITTGTVSGGTALNSSGNIVISKLTNAGSVLWVKEWAILNNTNNTYIPSIAVDTFSNVYVSYMVSSSISGQVFKGGREIVLTKLDTDGNVLWAIQNILSTTGDDFNPSIAVDSLGNVCIAYQSFGIMSGGINRGLYDIVVTKVNANGTLQWIKQHASVNTTANDNNPSIAIDTNGNSYVAYQTVGSVSGGSHRGFGDLSVFKLDTNGQIQWLNQYSAINTSNTAEQSPSVVADSAGNIFLVYTTGSSISGGATRGLIDIVLAKINTNGQIQWTRQLSAMNTTASDIDPKIALDPAGDVFVCYHTTGTISGGTNAGSNDIVFMKFSSADGQVQWSHQQPIFNTNQADTVPSITIDSDSNITIAYQTSGTVSGGSAVLGGTDIVLFQYSIIIPVVPTNIQANTSPRVFGARISWNNVGYTYNVYRSAESSGITKTFVGSVTNSSFYDDASIPSLGTYYYFINSVNGSFTSAFSSGIPFTISEALGWLLESSILNTTSQEIAPEIAIDPSGNICLTYCRGVNPYDIVIAKINSSGAIEWAVQHSNMNTGFDENNPSITTDSSGNIYIAYGSLGSVSGGSNKGNYDIVVVKVSPSSTILWTRQYSELNTTSADNFPYITTDISGNVYLTYQTSGSASGGLSSGGTDVVIVKLSGAGTIQWIRQTSSFNTPGNEFMPTIAVDVSGNVYGGIETTGAFSGGTNTGGIDVAIFKLDTNGNLVWINQPVSINTTVNDSRASISIDGAGAIYMSYQTLGTVSGGTNLGSGDLVLSKFDSNGSLIWLKQYPTVNSTNNESNVYITTDSYGNMYAAYVTTGTISGGIVNTSNDVCVTKVDTNGQLVWVKQVLAMNTTLAENAPHTVVDAVGNLYVTYQSSGTVSGGTFRGVFDIVLAKIVQSPVTATIPLPPTNVIARQLGSDTVIDWTPPLNSNNAVIIQYTITSSGGDIRIVNGTLQTVTYTGLTYGQTYTFQIYATNAVGNSSIVTTNPVSIYRTPTAPQFVTALANVSSVFLSWTAPLDPGDSALTGYMIVSIPSGFSTTVSPITTSLTISGLTVEQSYTFRVTAQNTYGSGPSSISNAVMPTTAPNPPIAVAVGGAFYGTLDVSWTPGYNGGAPIAFYIAQCIETKDAFRTSNTSVTFTNFDPRKTYSFVVYAVNKNGPSNPSAPTAAIYPSRNVFVLEWIKQSSPFNTTSTEDTPSIISDSSGNTYIAYTGGSVSGGIGMGNNDIIVGKFNTFGNLVWLKQHRSMNSISFEQNPSIVIDISGNVYIAYTTFGSVSGGSNRGSTDIVIAKLDIDGNFVWVQQPSALNTNTQDGFPRIAVNSLGECYITYSTSGTVSGGTSIGAGDIVVAKLNTNGMLQWIRQTSEINSIFTDSSPAIWADSSDAYLVYSAGITVSGGVLTGGLDIIVIKYGTNGNIVWARQNSTFNSNMIDSSPMIQLDVNGNIYVVYRTNGTVSGGTLIGNNDIVAFKMSPLGIVQWLRQTPMINTANDDQRPQIAVDSSGNLYIAHFTDGTVSGARSTGGLDIVLSKFTTNGVIEWVKKQSAFNTTATDQTPSISVDGTGAVYVAYYTVGTVSGGTYLGGGDIVLFKMSQAIPPTLLLPNNNVLPVGNGTLQAHGSVRIIGV